jgi:uncharacterized peroxidase-related enzyme
MTSLPLHSRESAPEGSHAIMDAYVSRFGFVPNLVSIMATSPATLNGYATGYGLMGETAFTPAEQQLIFLAVSRANGCRYCVAAHSMAGKMSGLEEAAIQAVRDGRPVLDPKLAAIVEFATKVVTKRGHVHRQDIETFLTAGHSQAQILEIILGVAVKTISNYMNHIAETPLDDAFAPMAWSPDAIAAQ